MVLKVLSCEVLTREVCWCAARAPHTVDPAFTRLGAHDDPVRLRAQIQGAIDACEDGSRRFDAICLCYGLCGNACAGLVARSIPLVIPRAHDCCTLFLGSRLLFERHFGDNPSRGFASAGYMEHHDPKASDAGQVRNLAGFDMTYKQLVERYGEENARDLWASLHPGGKPWENDKTVVFIDVPETRDLGYADRCREQAEAEGKRYVELPGSMDLVRKLLFGEWAEAEFLTVKPGSCTQGVYDLDEIIRAVPAALPLSSGVART